MFVANTIGVDSCNHATYPCVFGKAPWSRYHSFTVPSSAIGKTVYFAVDAYRYGTSPYGMRCVPSRSDVAQSLVYPNDSAHTISADAYNELYTKRSTRLFTLLDFLWEAYCYIPDLNYVRLTQEETDTLHARYFVADTVINGRQIWTAKPGCIGDSCTSFEKTVRFNDVRAHVHVPGSNILRVTGVQTDNSGVQLTLHADRTIHLRAAVYDVLGRENKHTPSTLVNAGIARLEVGLEGLQSGPVFIVLFDQHSTVLATIKVLR